jgi:hypothetical protein
MELSTLIFRRTKNYQAVLDAVNAVDASPKLTGAELDFVADIAETLRENLTGPEQIPAIVRIGILMGRGELKAPGEE